MPSRELAVRCVVIAMAVVAAGYPTFIADEITVLAPMCLLPAFVLLQRDDSDGAPGLPWLAVGVVLLGWSFLAHLMMGGTFNRLVHTFSMYAPFAVLAFRVRRPERLVVWFAIVTVLLLEARVVVAFLAAGGVWKPWQVSEGNMLAAKLNVLLPVVFVSMLSARDRGEARGPYLALLVTGVVCVVLVLSRAGMGIMAAIITLALVRWTWRSVIPMFGIALAAWVVAPDAIRGFLIKARFIDFRAVAPRRLIWAEAFELWRASPWFGVGPGNSSRTLVKTQNYHAHNDLVQATLEGGWPIGLTIAGIMVYVAALATRLFWWGGRSMFWGLSLLAYLAVTVVSSPLTRPDFTLVVILVLMVAREQGGRVTMTARPPALVLAGSRFLNKRIGLFLMSLRDSGFEPLLVAPPRRPWRLHGLEDPAGEWTTGVVTLRSARRDPAVSRVPRLIVCMHWSMLPIAVVLKWLVAGRLIYDEHDHYELLALEAGGPNVVRRARAWSIGLTHRWCLPRVDVVSCIRMAGGELRTRLEEHATAVVELHNYPSRRWQAPDSGVASDDGAIAIVYAGGLWAEKRCSHMIDAFSALAGQPGLPPISLHVFGAGDREIENRLRETPGVTFHGDSRYEEILACLRSRTCIGLNLLDNTPRYAMASTNCTKMFEYLATGTPVLATALGELPDIVARTGGGWTVDADADADGLALRLRQILADPQDVQRRGEAAAVAVTREGMRWEEEWKKLEPLMGGAQGLVHTHCPICGPSSYETFAACDGLTIVRCSGCELLFVNPRLGATAVADHFRHDYITDEARVTEELIAFREDSLAREAALLKRIRPGGGRLLDVGAASGALLKQFEGDPAWQAEGVEPSTFAARYARETLGLNVHTGFLRELGFASDSFDVVTSLDAFMLHPEPVEDLAEMVRILRPGGLIAMEIPGLWFRLHKNKGLLCRLLYGVPVRLNPRVHLYFYSRRTLTRLCVQHGLEFVASYPERSPAHGPRPFRWITSAYFAVSAAIYRLSSGALNAAPKEFIVFRKRAS